MESDFKSETAETSRAKEFASREGEKTLPGSALPSAAPLEEEGREENEEGEAFSSERSAEETEGLYPGDHGTLSLPLRRVLITLLKGPYLFRDKRKEAWNILMLNEAVLREQLSNLFLDLVIDEEVGVAFIRRPDLGEIEAPSLLNPYSFRFLDSVLLVEMRDRLMRAQQSGQRAVLSNDEIQTYLSVFDEKAKTDQALFKKHVETVSKRMKDRHLLLPLGRGGDSWEVSPVLKVVFDAAQVAELKNVYRDFLGRKLAATSLVEEDDEKDLEDDRE